MTVRQLSWFQLMALKNLYDQEIWPNKIAIIQETGDLIIEYSHSMVAPKGLPYTKNETINIPFKEPPISDTLNYK